MGENRKLNGVVFSEPVKNDDIRMKDLEPGELAEVLPGQFYEGHILIRGYDCVVDLNTGGTWMDLLRNNVLVRRLPAGTKVTIDVGAIEVS